MAKKKLTRDPLSPGKESPKSTAPKRRGKPPAKEANALPKLSAQERHKQRTLAREKAEERALARSNLEKARFDREKLLWLIAFAKVKASRKQPQWTMINLGHLRDRYDLLATEANKEDRERQCPSPEIFRALTDGLPNSYILTEFAAFLAEEIHLPL